MENNNVEMKEKPFHRGDLSLIEHTFIGASDEVKGEMWNAERVFTFLEQEKNADVIRKKLLRPLLLFEDEGKMEEVKKIREERKKEMRGMLNVFDLDQQVEMNLKDESIKQYIELSKVNEGGEVSGEWRVGLVNGAGNEIDSSGLKLDPDFGKYFALEKDINGKGKILKLSLKINYRSVI